MRKNIYIKDSDLPLFEWAENEVGDSLSSILAEALTLFKQRKEMEAKLAEQGYETITVNVQRAGSDYVQTKQFEGKWCINEFAADDEDRWYSVAHTKHGRIVITQDDPSPYSDNALSFQVFDSLKHVKAHNTEAKFQQNGEEFPEELVSAIAVELGEEHVEVLDI